MKKIAIIGAGGHGKVVADIARLNQYEEIVFLDDDLSLKTCGKYPIVGTSQEFTTYMRDGYNLIVATGNAGVREKIQKSIEENNGHCDTLIHPSAVVAEDVEIGCGSVIMANAVINSGTTIGKSCIINTSASVDHDNVISDYAHIAVSSHLAGEVRIGKKTWVGIGAIISNNIAVCENCMIGAGAVVIKDIKKAGTYIGNPARPIKFYE